MRTWAIGVFLGACASVLGNLGITTQKLAHQRARDVTTTSRPYYTRPDWIAGLLLTVVASVADFIALGLAAQSVIAPLGSLTLVANAVFAPLLLGERFTRRDALSTAFIVAGTVLTVSFASHDDSNLTMHELNDLFLKPRTIALFVSLVGLALALRSAVGVVERVRAHQPDEYAARRLVRSHAFFYAALAGVVGSQNVMFAKSISGLVRHWVSDDAATCPLLQWETHVLAACLATTIVLQVRWINRALQLFDAVFVVPVFQCFWIILSVASGLICFGEFRTFAASQFIMFALGVIVTVVGVMMVTQHEFDAEELNTPFLPARIEQSPRRSASGDAEQGAAAVPDT